MASGNVFFFVRPDNTRDALRTLAITNFLPIMSAENTSLGLLSRERALFKFLAEQSPLRGEIINRSCEE
jgi:hypothetical protein